MAPNALQEAKDVEACHNLRGIGDLKHGVNQNVFQSAIDLQHGLAGGCPAHPQKLVDLPQAGRHGELKEGDGHQGLLRKRRVHGSGLLH